MGDLVQDAKKAVEIAKEYAKVSMQLGYWKDVVECQRDEKTGYWRVIFLASPGLMDQYFRYEVLIDAGNGAVRSSRRIGR